MTFGSLAPTRVKVSKPSVQYRRALSSQKCGNCGMFSNPHHRPKGQCDLVAGEIDPKYTCIKWTKGKGK